MNSLPPQDVLEVAYQKAEANLGRSFLNDKQMAEAIRDICAQLSNRAPIRFLMACCLAKIHNPAVDIRAPYTEIQDEAYANRKYSGRAYDEGFVESFVFAKGLPARATTAFLTPAFRTKNIPLVPGTDLGGRPFDKRLYDTTLEILDEIEQGRLSAEAVLTEIIRNLLELKKEQVGRMLSLLEELKTPGSKSLSSEDIVTLVKQHMSSPRSSRLPVLVVAAAYQAASDRLGERMLPLQSHLAADSQTGTFGDIEVTLIGDDEVVTSYEMKTRRITREDIERGIDKIADSGRRIDNYIFITTDQIEDEVNEYAKSLYGDTGIEFVILDCIGFLRHFLHLFHRIRLDFLDAYQSLLLDEPDSAVRQPLKETFLALRRAAESSYQE